MAAIPKHAASGTGNVQLEGHGCHLLGINIDESAGTAAAAMIVLHDGSDTDAPEVFRAEFAGDESQTHWFGPQGIRCNNGLFLERVDGETTVTAYIA